MDAPEDAPDDAVLDDAVLDDDVLDDDVADDDVADDDVLDAGVEEVLVVDDLLQPATPATTIAAPATAITHPRFTTPSPLCRSRVPPAVWWVLLGPCGEWPKGANFRESP